MPGLDVEDVEGLGREGAVDVGAAVGVLEPQPGLVQARAAGALQVHGGGEGDRVADDGLPVDAWPAPNGLDDADGDPLAGDLERQQAAASAAAASRRVASTGTGSRSAGRAAGLCRDRVRQRVADGAAVEARSTEADPALERGRSVSSSLTVPVAALPASAPARSGACPARSRSRPAGLAGAGVDRTAELGPEEATAPALELGEQAHGGLADARPQPGEPGREARPFRDAGASILRASSSRAASASSSRQPFSFGSTAAARRGA